MDTAVMTSEMCESQQERRRLPRQQFVTKALLYREKDQGSGPQQILLKDLSILGLGFESDVPIETGTRCRVVVEAGPTRINWRLRIVCCGRIDANLYRLGCEFLPAERDLFDLSGEDLGLSDDDEVLIIQ
jgi:hypothetical protein